MYVDENGNFAFFILTAVIGAIIGGLAAGITSYQHGARGWEVVGWSALGSVCGGQELLEVLLIWLVRCTTLSLQVEETPRSDSRECVEIKRYLDSNFREDISLDRLAEIAHINKYYLAHTFQKEYGISPITYLNRRRIEESKYMLGNTGYSLAQISELMGFSSPSYFSHCFRKAEGLTPNEYRRQVRQGQRPAPAKRHER